jgi:hypothetical protein
MHVYIYIYVYIYMYIYMKRPLTMSNLCARYSDYLLY